MRVWGLVVVSLVALAFACGGGDDVPAEEPVAAPGVVDEQVPTPPAVEPVETVASKPEPAAGPDREELIRLRQAVADAPDDLQARRRLAIALHSAGRREESLKQFEELVERRPIPRFLLDLALAYSSVSRLTDAENTYKRLLALSPGDALALHNLGNIAVKRGELDKAIGLYNDALRSKPDYVLARYHLADAFKQAGRYQESYQRYEGVLELEPKTPQELQAVDDSLYNMASLDLQMGAHERAAQLLQLLLSTNPDHPSAHYAYGQVLMQLGRTEAAQREFDIHMRILAEQEPTGPVATRE